MPKSTLIFPTIAVLLVTSLIGVSSWTAPDTVIPLQQVTATAISINTLRPDEDSWIIVNLPPDATQLEHGAEVYRQVCKACHGDKGQGLTDDWRAQWAPEDQNCWQSKCHAANHPPEGFTMPVSPAVVGTTLMRFETALALHDYIQNYMPWHNRGSMTNREYWSVTAYILKMNNIDPGPELNAESAAQIRLRGDTMLPESSAPIGGLQRSEANTVSPFWTAAIVLTVVLGFIGILMLIRRNTD